MTFEESIAEMKVLAGNNDWSFQYQVASYLQEANIVAYINRIGVGHAKPHNTYQGAIDNMKAKINAQAEIDDPAPKGEVA
jgi:hypothetical protein